jgi:hypothetical protein
MAKKIHRFAVGGAMGGGARGGLDTVNQGSGQIGKSLDLIEQGLTGEQKSPVSRVGAEQTPAQGVKNLGLNMKRGGIVKKVKKFADGGGMPTTAYPSVGTSQNGGAYGGLDTITSGRDQVGQSLGTIQSGLTGSANPTQTPKVLFDEMNKRTTGTPGLTTPNPQLMKRGGKVKKMASGGSTSSASKRADGIATKGKTKGRFV